jgi:hypothetical protein
MGRANEPYPRYSSFAQQPDARWSCIGGHGTDPWEQNTQQSPLFGRNLVPQPVHS